MPEKEMEGWEETDKESKHKAPNTKLQAPEKSQNPNSKMGFRSAWRLEARYLELLWSLELDVWMFAAIWNFFAFISEFSCIADAELESA
jgi:hypothetical protein